MSVPQYVLQLMNRLYENGYECYIVGGAVRSWLLGLPIHDYDLSTSALPQQMKEVFSDFKTIETGIRHGTLTVISHHHPVEITTYRKESFYGDHRHPDSVEFTSAVCLDCARRDFTVNAMCYSPQEGLKDFFGGSDDLKQRILRCIGNPRERFDEDALRILRALRFAAVLGFTIDPDTGNALKDQKELLHFISAERIRAEMEGFLNAPECAGLLSEYREVFEIFLPELKSCSEEKWEETLAAITASIPDAAVRMAILIRDEKYPEEILKRLKYSGESIRTITSLITLKDMPFCNRCDLRRILNRLACSYPLYTGLRCALDPSIDQDAMNCLFQEIIQDGDCIHLSQLPVNGNDMKQLGYEGREIAQILDSILEEVMADRLSPSYDEIMTFAKR